MYPALSSGVHGDRRHQAGRRASARHPHAERGDESTGVGRVTMKGKRRYESIGAHFSTASLAPGRTA